MIRFPFAFRILQEFAGERKTQSAAFGCFHMCHWALLGDLTLSYNARMTTTPRRSRVFSISMPPEMAVAAEFLAKQENRSMSELFREAFRIYHAQKIGAIFDEIGKYAASRNPNGYTEDDVERLVDEVRAEMRAEKDAKQAIAS
jgi:hypothetical protein